MIKPRILISEIFFVFVLIQDIVKNIYAQVKFDKSCHGCVSMFPPISAPPDIHVPLCDQNDVELNLGLGQKT